MSRLCSRILRLFIILFLHQTTTNMSSSSIWVRCLSSCSYIKPQHNTQTTIDGGSCLSSCSYIKPQQCYILFRNCTSCLSSCSYIKPQPFSYAPQHLPSCLSSCSYIKPQPNTMEKSMLSVVYHLVPTSNHNQWIHNG